MMYLADHAANNFVVLFFHHVVELSETEHVERSLLILGSSDSAFGLFNLYRSHNLWRLQTTFF